jgi:hypothetical protein
VLLLGCRRFDVVVPGYPRASLDEVKGGLADVRVLVQQEQTGLVIGAHETISINFTA